MRKATSDARREKATKPGFSYRAHWLALEQLGAETLFRHDKVTRVGHDFNGGRRCRGFACARIFPLRSPCLRRTKRDKGHSEFKGRKPFPPQPEKCGETPKRSAFAKLTL